MKIEKFSIEKLRFYLHFEMFKCMNSAAHWPIQMQSIRFSISNASFNRTVWNLYAKQVEENKKG